MQSGLGQFLRSAKLARLYALADQGAQGLANLVAISVLGRHLPTGQFGAVGMAMGLYYVVAGFHRSAVILPYITEHGSDDRAYHSDWWWLNVLFGAGLTAILLGLAGGLALGTEWWPQAIWGVMPLALGALMTLPLLCAEHLRRWLYKRERADLVALVSGIYLAWALAGSVATLLPLVWLRPAWPDWPASWNCLARHRRFASWLALTIVPYMVYSSATVVVFIGLFNGPLAAAVFTAGRTLTNPAISMVSAVDSIDKPRAARAFAEQ